MPAKTRARRGSADLRGHPRRIASKWEEAFATHCHLYNLSEPTREHRFAAGRRFRFDFCFLPYKVAVEIEGGVWTFGRHTRGSGFNKDLEKYNLAALDGWMVLRFSPEMVRSGEAVKMTVAALRARGMTQ